MIPDEEASHLWGLRYTGGVTAASAYYHRGYLVSDSGLVVQPSLTVFKTWQVEPFIVTPYFTVWNSAHLFGSDGPAVSMGGNGFFRQSTDWDEFKCKGGVVGKYGPCSLDLNYILYTFHGDEFGSVQEIGTKFSYDLLLKEEEEDAPATFGLKPSLGLYFETVDRHDGQDIYAEAGLEPYCRFCLADYHFGFSLPAVLGMSVDDYYFQADGDPASVGYFSISSSLTVALPTQSKLGTAYLTGTIEYLHLIADNLRAMNDGDANELIGRIGLSFSF